MLNLNRQSFDNIRKLLKRQEKDVKEELKRIHKDDPVYEEGLSESIEPGTSSWMAEVHSRAVSVKDSLQDLLKKTQKSLANLNKGTYGKCEKCGKQIEEKRLLAMPTATMCVSCSKKYSK